MRSRRIEKLLNCLITENNSLGLSIITGYNYYAECLGHNYPSLAIFSNLTNSKEYIAHAQSDLELNGLLPPGALIVRDQQGYFKWKPRFHLQKEDKMQDKELAIVDYKSGEPIDIKSISKPTLEAAGWDEKRCRYLIAQTNAFEIDIALSDINILPAIADLFYTKSIEIKENPTINTEICPPARCWPGAWETPTIIIRKVPQHLEIPGFFKATLISRELRRTGEYSFVIHNKTGMLCNSREYKRLQRHNFHNESCLCNDKFINDYVDE